MNVKNDILKALEMVSGTNNPNLEFTDNMDFGDYSSNIAMTIFANQESGSRNQGSKHMIHDSSSKSPRTLAEDIVSKLTTDSSLSAVVEKIETAGPGFINFWLKKDVLVDNLIQIDGEKESFGTSDINKGKTVIVEYSSPNIAKPFGIGHLRSTVIGDSIANLLEATGWKVMRDNHLGDWGTQFGKMIYAIKTWGDEAVIEKSENPVKELVDLYVKFHAKAEIDSALEEKARDWFKKLEVGDSEARRLWKKCIDWSFVEFDRIYDILGVKFSQEFEDGRGLGESFFESRMGTVIDELEAKKMLIMGEEGAKLVFFDKYSPIMIVKKDGATLYATRDLATDKYRLEKYDPDLIINETGSEQSLYFKQIFETEKLLGWYKEGQRVHIGHGLIRFKDGKMSTRRGNVIWMEEVLAEAVARAKKLGSETSELAQMVAVGALKYNDLKRDPKTNIVFDWNEILNMEGNSGPYLQYTVARCNSVIFKGPTLQGSTFKGLERLNLNSEELSVLRKLSQFHEVIVTAAKSYSPNLLCNYLYDLAQKYNGFYNKHKIIADSGHLQNFRLLLTKATGQVLKNGLKILGIQAPERM